MKVATWRLCLTFVLFLLFSMLHFTGVLEVLNLPLMLLFILYVQIFVPKIFNVVWVFLLGLYYDVLFSTLMGEHVMAFLLPCFFISLLNNRFIFLSILQQLVWILISCLLYLMSMNVVDYLMGDSVSLLSSLCVSLLGMLLWPTIRFCLEFRVMKI